MSEVLEMAIREQRLELEQARPSSARSATTRPSWGLLGTCSAWWRAFQQLGSTAGMSMGTVMGGIAEALIATALGIGVALPAVVAYNLFTKRAYETEDNARALMNLILAYRKSIRFGTLQACTGRPCRGLGLTCLPGHRREPAHRADHGDQHHPAGRRGARAAASC
jgi:hypothetical protein